MYPGRVLFTYHAVNRGYIINATAAVRLEPLTLNVCRRGRAYAACEWMVFQLLSVAISGWSVRSSRGMKDPACVCDCVCVRAFARPLVLSCRRWYCRLPSISPARAVISVSSRLSPSSGTRLGNGISRPFFVLPEATEPGPGQTRHWCPGLTRSCGDGT